jgi:RimJ/RimL family protein N-acetyltransferase
MGTDFHPDLEQQKHWLAKASSDNSYEHWLIKYKSKKIGLINLSYNESSTEPDWGYYVGEEDSVLLGGIIPHYFYYYTFVERKLTALHANVAEDNTVVYKLHTSHGYREVGVIKNGIDKPALRNDLLRLRLAAEDWCNSPFAKRNYEANWESENPILTF